MPTLRALLDQLYYEDNRALGRHVPRLSSLAKKSFALLPQAMMFVFFNFASALPSKAKTRARKPEPVPAKPISELIVGAIDDGAATTHARQGGSRVVVDAWPRDANGRERGLALSDAVVLSARIGHVLCAATDLVFVMKELHRVCVPDARVEVVLPPVSEQMLALDPTHPRIVTPQTLEFFGDRSAALPRGRGSTSSDAGAAGLYRIVSKREDDDGVHVELEVKKAALAPARPTRIDLGCGSAKRPGCAGIDRAAIAEVDIVRDIERHGIPLSDGTVEYVFSSHFLEHVSDLVFVMNEIHRVCCHDALVEITVPTLLGPWAAADPTHVRLFNARTFQYFEKYGAPPNVAAGASARDYADIVQGFEILEQRVSTSMTVALRVLKAEGEP